MKLVKCQIIGIFSLFFFKILLLYFKKENHTIYLYIGIIYSSKYVNDEKFDEIFKKNIRGYVIN